MSKRKIRFSRGGKHQVITADELRLRATKSARRALDIAISDLYMAYNGSIEDVIEFFNGKGIAAVSWIE